MLTLQQNTKPVYYIQPEKSHPRTTLFRVLKSKFYKWLHNATPHAIRKAFLRTSGVVSIAFAVLAPQFFLGVLFAVSRFAGFQIAAFFILCGMFLHGKKMIRLAHRRIDKKHGNQNTFHGLPIDELASHLCEHGFKRDHTIKALGLSKGNYEKIAKIFDDKKITVRDHNYGRVLNTISRENLVIQLTKNFPLVFDETRTEWVERDGTFNRWVLDREREERKRVQKAERVERRIKKAQKQLRDISDIGFTSRCVVA